MDMAALRGQSGVALSRHAREYLGSFLSGAGGGAIPAE